MYRCAIPQWRGVAWCDALHLRGFLLGGKKIALRGGGEGDTEAHFPNPPPPSLAAVTGGGGSGRGCPTCAGGGGGGSTQHLWLKMIPTSG